MKRYMIFVEGKADACFIRDYFKFLFSDYKISNDGIKEKELRNSENIFKIVVVGGCNKIKNDLKVRIEEIKDFKYNLLVIQDADSLAKDKKNGGVQQRRIYLDSIEEELKVNFDTFLFPNNEDDGDLETLLLRIVKEEQFQKTTDCYKNWTECLKNISPIQFIDELLENKNIVYNYFRTFYGMNKAKEEERVYSEEFWNFSSKELNPLKVFFENIISKNK